MDIEPELFLRNCFNVAVAAAMPDNFLEAQLPADRTSPVIVIAAGKAAASMSAAFENAWQGPVQGIAVTPYGHSSALCKNIKVMEASHPNPDHNSVTAAENILDLLDRAPADAIVVTLLSGGGSSLLCLPADPISLSDKLSINAALLKSGAAIDEINCVRKHLSAIKGGRLAAYAAPRPIFTYAISDVVGDDAAVIASGPTAPDGTTSKRALEILVRYGIKPTPSVEDWLNNPASETPKFIAGNLSYNIVASSKTALRAAENYARQNGIDCINLGEIEADARTLGLEHAQYARSLDPTKTTLILSGGETTVRVCGNGKGGRNSEYLLSLALQLKDNETIYALAADTDGIDGTTDAAGAVIAPGVLRSGQALGLDGDQIQKDNDSYRFFNKLDRLIVMGPTLTNVNDFRAILIVAKP